MQFSHKLEASIKRWMKIIKLVGNKVKGGFIDDFIPDSLHDIEKKVKIFLYLKKDFNAWLHNNVHTT